MTNQELDSITKQVLATNKQTLTAAKEEAITINHIALILSGINMLLLCILSEVNKDVQTAN